MFDDLYLKSLRLKNYCQYEDHTFNFTKEDGSPFPYICFFGPNGSGKSTALEAISTLTMNTLGRSANMVKESLQKYVRNLDYDPLYNRFHDNVSADMLIQGTYVMTDSTGTKKEYIVEVNSYGWVRNDFADSSNGTSIESPFGDEHLKYRQRINHFVRTDSDLSMNKFQLVASQMKNFEEIMTEIMRYPIKCISPKGTGLSDKGYCLDYTLEKKGHLVHFKRMSAGEKKITKSFSDLFNLIHDLENPVNSDLKMKGWPRLLLIDNVEMHVYYDRHVRLIECLKRVFNKQQIFATTHSGVLVERFLSKKNDTETELMINVDEINNNNLLKTP